MIDISRLKAQLLTSGLQIKDPPLFQVIDQLIRLVGTSLNPNSGSGGGGGGGGNQTIINPTQFLMLEGTIGEDGIDGIGIKGDKGDAGVSGVIGPAGIGFPGFDGDDGFDGWPGPQGNIGITGATGIPGISAGRIFYLDPLVASDIAGYKVALADPSVNAETTLTASMSGTGDNLLASFATPPNVPNVTALPAGTAFRHIHAKTDAANQIARLKVDLYRCNADGSGETLLRSGYSEPFNGPGITENIWNFTDGNQYTFTTTQRIVFKVSGARVSGPATCNLTVYFDGNVNASFIQTTISVGITGAQGPQGLGIPGIDGDDGEFIIQFDSNAALKNRNEIIVGIWDFIPGLKERGRSLPIGEWTDVAYNSANFTASAGTWTVNSADQITFAYNIVGKTITVAFALDNTDVSVGGTLKITIPGGYTAKRAILSPCVIVIDAGVAGGLGIASVAVSSTFIRLYASLTFADFSVAAGNTSVFGLFTFEIN